MPTVTRSSKGSSSPCVARAQFHGQTRDPNEWCSALVVEDGHVAFDASRAGKGDGSGWRWGCIFSETIIVMIP